MTETLLEIFDKPTFHPFPSPGFKKPEGVVIFHAQANVMFKKTIEGDEAGKGHGG